MQPFKIFSPEHYEADDNAKHLVIDWIRQTGYEAWVNPDQYGIDILAEGKGRELAFEVEVKHNWTGDRFPFPTLHFSARKQKFLDTKREVRFITLNDERSHLLITTAEQLAKARTIRKHTMYTQNEPFIEVWVSGCTMVEINVTT